MDRQSTGCLGTFGDMVMTDSCRRETQLSIGLTHVRMAYELDQGKRPGPAHAVGHGSPPQTVLQVQGRGGRARFDCTGTLRGRRPCPSLSTGVRRRLRGDNSGTLSVENRLFSASADFSGFRVSC